MQNRPRKQNQFRFFYSAIAKMTSNAGQSKFAMDAVAKYMHLNTIGKYSLSSAAMAAGLMVNAGVRLPVIYAHCQKQNVENANSYELANMSSKIFYKTLVAFAFISTEINDSLAAYLGGVTLLEHSMSLFKIDMTATLWQEIITQLFGVVMGVGIGLANYSYDFKFIKDWLHEITEEIEKKNFVFNKSFLEMLGISLPTLIGMPLLNYFFARPAIGKIPGANFVLHDIGVLIIALVLSAAALVKCIGVMRPTYKTFLEFNNGQPDASIGREFPNSCKVTSIKICAGLGGAGDSIAAGLCMVVGFISTAILLFHLSQDKQYDARLIIAAALIGLCQAVQNALFSVYPGYKETIKIIHSDANDIESQQPLLVEEENTLVDEINEQRQEEQSVEEEVIYSAESKLFKSTRSLMEFSKRESVLVNIDRRKSLN